MADAFGAITWWGFSPAIDLQDEDEITALRKLKITDPSKEELNILLIGAGDIRHILMTVARSYRHHKKKLHFYVLENNLELYARDMLFLALALEPQTRMGLQEKTELFLELYGNILIRKQSEEYIQRMANDFIKMVTDFDYLTTKLPCVDLTNLKFKERDFLEGIFKFWRNTDTKNLFEVSTYWDLRQRKYLGVRYDARNNLYDWDYQMRLAQREADIINVHEYKHWRNTGVAFEVREADYEIPNKTMASGLILMKEGEKTARRGYWGDILVSPYVALGILCEEKSFYKKANKQFMKSACNIAEYNVLAMFHELSTKSKYTLPETEPETEKPKDTGPTITEITEETEAELQKDQKSEQEKKAEGRKEENGGGVGQGDEGGAEGGVEHGNMGGAEGEAETEKKPLDEPYAAMDLEDVAVSFLPLASLLDMPKKKKYQNLFDIVYFSNSLVHNLKPEVNPIFADKATVILESARYMLELKLEQVKAFVDKVQGIAKTAGCKSMDKCNPESANFIKMAFERSKES